MATSLPLTPALLLHLTLPLAAVLLTLLCLFHAAAVLALYERRRAKDPASRRLVPDDDASWWALRTGVTGTAVALASDGAARSLEVLLDGADASVRTLSFPARSV